MAVIDELIALLGFQIEGEEDLERFRGNLRSAGQSVSRFADQVAKAGAVAGAAFAAMGVSLARSSLKIGMEQAKFATILETVEGSAEAAEKSLEWVKDFAAETPFDIAQVTDAFVRMKVNGLDPIANDSLRTIGDAAMAMGKDMIQGVEAIADAARGENERLKELGITAKQAGDTVVYEWSQAGETMRRTVEKDGVAITKALVEIFDRRFGGTMERQNDKLENILNNMGDNWRNFQQAIADAGWYAYVEGKMKELRGWVGGLEEDGTITRYATQISDAYIAIAEAVLRMGRLFRDVESWVGAENAIKAIAGAMLLLMRRAFPLGFAIALIVAGLDDLQSYREGGESLFGSMVEYIQEMLGVAEGAAQKIAGIGAAILGLGLIKPGLVFRPLLAGIRGLGPLIYAALAGAITAIKWAGLGLLLAASFIKAFIGALATAIASAGLGAAIVAQFGAALAFLATPAGWAVILAGLAAALVAYFWDDLKALWNSVNWSELGTAIADGILNGLRSGAAAIRDFITSLIPDFMKIGLPQASAGAPGTIAGESVARAALSQQSPSVAAQQMGGNTTTTQINNIDIQQTFTGSTTTAGQVRAGTIEGGHAMIRSLGTTAPSPAQ